MANNQYMNSGTAANTRTTPGLRIVNLSKWLSGWNKFVQANAVFHPQLIPKLLAYQARICQYAEHHNFSSVVCYDAAVRTRIANNPDLLWDDQFPDEFNSFLEGRHSNTAYSATCFVCQMPGHVAASCPLRSTYPTRPPPVPPQPTLEG